MTTEETNHDCAASRSTDGFACDGCKRLKVWAESAWARGHAMGMQENKRIAREATAALEAEKEAHAETNVRLTEALMMAEEELARMQANALAQGPGGSSPGPAGATGCAALGNNGDPT